eukprot:355265-Chlamydomonas_euryale.AAC.14
MRIHMHAAEWTGIRGMQTWQSTRNTHRPGPVSPCHALAALTPSPQLLGDTEHPACPDTAQLAKSPPAP